VSFEILASVDIVDGRCAYVLQGRFGSQAVYSDDPVEVGLGFCRAGARWLHVADLDGSRTGRRVNREELLRTISGSSCPVQASGGLASLPDVEEVLAAGAQRAVASSFALQDRVALEQATARYGERMAGHLDARGDAGDEGWVVGTGVGVLDAATAFEDAGVAVLVYTHVDTDGAMSGPDLEGLRRVAARADLPVIASGGIASLDDVRAVSGLAPGRVSGAIVGRALYEGKFTLKEAMEVAVQAAEDD
jgi:phosphoribosylformimino-5-aminoimidazole carboxamide ribotide isomerase